MQSDIYAEVAGADLPLQTLLCSGVGTSGLSSKHSGESGVHA